MLTHPESGLVPAECRDLRRLAGIMIPANQEFGVPGADDALIFADVIRSLGRDLGDVQVALTAISVLAGGAFADLHDGPADTAVKALLARNDRAAATLGRVILAAYYRDDRVLLALGLEPRSPFPRGYTLEQGDWSLLDPVRGRPQLWRDDRAL